MDGFVAHVLAFMPVEVVDIRPLDSAVAGLKVLQDDAMSLAKIASESVVSLSSLHAAEHFGLGRYGDPVDSRGWERGMRALSRVLAPNGALYFSVPIGREQVRFNAHRIFSPATVLEAFSDLELVSFSAVDDDSRVLPEADPRAFETADMACGLFEFRKRPR
ncbi:MAG: DUF268 domain-containing protein [Myxococcales bacterium]|nr:DUF268 domain-containing protein [Myxococcales bacterium]